MAGWCGIVSRQADIIRPGPERRLAADRARRGLFDRCLIAAVLGALGLTAASWMGTWLWSFELLTHFRFQFVAASVVLLLLACIRRQAAAAVAVLFVAVLNGWPLAPYIVPGAAEARAAQPEARLLMANVQFRNDDYQAALGAIAREDPDVVGLVEVTDAWIGGLTDLHAAYPYSILRPSDDAHGLALYSRLPIRELEGSPYVEEGMQTALLVQAELPDGPALLVLAHPMSPVSPAAAALRNRQLEALAAMLRAEPGKRKILIGDLNTTPWSPYYARLEEQSGLVNAALGRGYWPTWPTWGATGLMRIPIDHCLVSGGIEVQRFRTGDAIGSDHLPLVVDIAGANAL